MLPAQVARPSAPETTPAAPAPASAEPTLAAPVAAEPKSTLPARLKEMVQKKTLEPSKQKILPPSPTLELPIKEGKGGKELRKPLATGPVSGKPLPGDAGSKISTAEEMVPFVLPSAKALLQGDLIRNWQTKWGHSPNATPIANIWHKTDTQIGPTTVTARANTKCLAAEGQRSSQRPRRPRPPKYTCRVVVSGAQGGVRWDTNPLETRGATVLEVEAQIDVFVGDYPLKVALTYENASGVHMGQPVEVSGKDGEYVRVSLPSPLQGKTQVISGDKSDPLTGTQPVKFGVMIIPQGKPDGPVTVGIENFEVRVATATGASPTPATKAPASK